MFIERYHIFSCSYRILVMSNGSVREFDEPKLLANNSRSEFSKLLRNANVRFD